MPLTNYAFADLITFTRSTTATFVGSNGLIQSAAINAPRFDFNPATLAPNGLLMEEQRVNLMTYSEQFDNAGWSKTNSTITANATTAPDGAISADTITDDITLGQHQANQNFSTVSGTTYVLSCFFKQDTARYARLALGGTAMNFAAATFDLQTGTVLSGTASITSFGNGWFTNF
jgi:hypothetical protein